MGPAKCRRRALAFVWAAVSRSVFQTLGLGPFMGVETNLVGVDQIFFFFLKSRIEQKHMSSLHGLKVSVAL